MADAKKFASGQGCLHIGDTVLFMIKTRECNSYVYSELSSSPYNVLTVKPAEETDSNSVPYFPNVTSATFKVLAPNKYKAIQYLRDLEQKKGADYEILNAKRALDVENLENELEQQRRFGSKVFYGDLIQLQHISSKKFVKVCSEASKTESNNLLVNLTEENAEGCIFKLLPRYKVRSEGDEIRFGDQLKIESTKTQGQFLHCSSRTLGQSKFLVSTDCFELNISATESALTLFSHYCPSTKHPENALRAGTCVRLFHKEDECYIVAEGSFAEQNPVIEDVHCRLRHVDSRKHSAPSTSSNTYWQIEKQEDTRSGDVISWRERCRLKHLPTRQYLAVVKETEQDEEWKVTLKEWSGDNDLDTIFSFHPLIEEGDEVLLESYALIRHLRSRQWLHLDKRNHYIRKNFKCEAKGLAGLQWDTAELYMLTTSKDRGDYDSFTIQEVTEDLVDRFNYSAGIVPVLAAFNEKVHLYLDQRQKQAVRVKDTLGLEIRQKQAVRVKDTLGLEIRQKQAVRVKDTLIELGNWMVTDHDRDTKNNQKLLRNLRILDQISEILKIGNDEVEISKHYIIEICRECYNVIKMFLEGDSRKNENYLARFIEFFQTQMRKGLNAEEALVEIVQDNLTIVSTMADTQMSHMIQEFVNTEDPRFLYFLSSLCVCGGRPIPSTQNRLLNELVLARGKDLFLRTKTEKVSDKEYRVLVCEPGSDKTTLITKIKEQSTTERRMTIAMKKMSKPTRNLYELLEAQLHLFAKLCKGNNKDAINTLLYVEPDNTDGYIRFDEVLLCAQDPQIDPTIRLRYIELILVMFVDVGDNRSFLDHLCYSFVYADLCPVPYADTGDDETEALTTVVNLHFPQLKLWILKTLRENCELKCDKRCSEENSVLKQVLEVLSYLVRYGYYDDIGDVDEVMIPLIQILDGNTDQPVDSIRESEQDYKEFMSTGRKEDVPENETVFDVKIKALEVMQLFFRFKFYVKLQKFMYDFKVLAGTERKSVGKVDKNPFDPPKELASLIKVDHKHPQDFLFSDKMINVARHRIQFLCDGNVKGSGFAPSDDSVPSLENVLLDLSEYECEELVTSSLNLLTQMYFFEEELFSKAHQGQLLTSPESLNDYKEINENIVPKLRQLLRVDADRKDQDKIIELISTLCDLCMLPFNIGTGEEPNKQNQIMLDNFGLVSEIVSYVLAKGDQGSQVGTISDSSVVVSENVFKQCFCLLRRIATDYLSVQARLFNRIDDLLEVKIPTPALADLADLFTEVFTGGPELILKVSESHIEKIFEIIIHSDNVHVQAHFMVTLEAMAKIEELDLPVGHNQALIVKNFCRFRDTFCQEILRETPDIEQKRMEILQDDTNPQGEVLLGVVDMLAACAEGKNRFIESVCQNILSIEELVGIMSSNLPPAKKRPFVRFLIWVYLITEEDEQNNQGSELTHGDTMWKYLKHLACLLEGVATVLSGISVGEIENLRNELTTSNRRRTSFSSPRRTAASPTRKVSRVVSTVGIADVTDENGELIPGLLEYLADGVIPLLHTYYSSYFKPETLTKVDDKEKEFEISGNIAKGLMHLSRELVQVFSSEKNIEMYQETLNTLLSYPDIKETSNIDEEQAQVVQGVLDTTSTPKKKLSHRRTLERGNTIESIAEVTDEQVMENYKQQEKLNDLFNNYSRNYQYCYMGPNTASHQINASVDDIEYSDEGEELPLGPSFQYLVQLYIDPLTSQELKVKANAENLLQQLEISASRTEQLGEDEQVNQDILDARCLKILRALIHNEIKLIDPELKDRDPIEFRQKSDDLVVPVQNRIQSFNNAIRRIIPFLSHTNESISREALALMKALLFSGNEVVQEGLVESVKQTREEILFLNLKQRLETASSNYKETNDLRSQLISRQQAKVQPVSEIDKEATLQNRSRSLTKATSLTMEPPVTYNGKEVAISLEVLNKTDDSDTSPLISTFKRSRGVTFNETEPDSKTEEIEEESNLLSQLQTSDNNWTSLVLEVIGLMCDGQHRTLQNYLREQPDNFKTINVVAEVAMFLHTYAGDLTQDENFSQVHQILQSLIEMSVGNVQNKQVIFDKLVVDPLNRILQLPLDNLHKDCQFEETATEKCPDCAHILHLIEVKGSAVELLDVMLEETSNETLSIATGIGSSLDVESVLKTMSLFHELKSHSLVKKKQMDDDCERGMFKAYHALLSLIDYDAINIKSKKELKKKADELKAKESFNASAHNSRSIEIHYVEEGSKPMLAKVYFPYDPQDELREEITELVRWNVERDSMEDKQRALVDLMPSLKRDVLHQAKLKDTKILQPLLAFHTWRARLLLLITIILNLFVLFLYKVPPEFLVTSAENTNDTNNTNYYSVFLPNTEFWFENILLYILGAIHLIMSLWIVVEYFLINFPHFRLPQFFHTIRVMLIQYFCKNQNFSTRIPQITCLDVNIFGIATLYMIILVVCSILSLVFRGYFYCLCLLFIIVDNDILKRVLRAVTKNGISLIWVAILGFIVLFIYAVISFAFLHNQFVHNSSLYCDTLGQCMYTVLRFGLLDNLGTAIPFSTSAFNAPSFTARLIFDLSFFIIITTIGLNIVFGIIVDTFSELREERSNIESDQKSKCFICDMPSYDFERRAQGFINHVKCDHNMWDYVYYSLYIDNIDTGDHNAIQKYVYELICDNDTGFFPQEEARCLIGEEDTTGEKIEELQEKVDSILQHFREKEHAKSINAKKQEQKQWEEQIHQMTMGPQASVERSPSDRAYY